MTETFWTGSEFLRDTFPCKFVQEITFKHVKLQDGLASAGMQRAALNSALPQPAACTAVRKDNTTLYKHIASIITI